jgi:hypothetical protein
MPKEIGWWKKRHDTRERDEFRRLITRYGFEGYGWYTRIVDRMRKLDDGKYGLFIEDDEILNELSEDLKMTVKQLSKFIGDCCESFKNGDGIPIFSQENGWLFCPELTKDMEVHDAVKERLRQGAKITNDLRRSGVSTGKSIGEVLSDMPIVNARRNGKRSA